MIHFPATLEIMFCLLGGIVIGFIIGWLFTSLLIGTVIGIGAFCWLLDIAFSFSIEEDDEY